MNDSFENGSADFMSWLSQNKALINQKIALQDLRSQGAGRGVVATSDIFEDEVLFQIPRAVILSTANSALPKKTPDAFSDLDPWSSLILVMIYEYSLGKDSTWKPYFDILPEQFDTLMYWFDEELDQLQGSAVRQKIGKDSANKMFLETILPVVKQNIEHFPPDTHPHLLSEPSFLQIAHRMGSLIMAYAFDIEAEMVPKELDDEGFVSEDEDEALPKGMVPLADMLNADADRNNSRLFYEPEGLTMKPLRFISAGEEIFNDYGPLPRSDLLRRYGYVTRNYAKYDVVEISHSSIVDATKAEFPEQSAYMEERLSYLDDECGLDEGYDISKTSDEHDDDLEEFLNSFSPELQNLLATIFATQADFDKCKQKHKIPKFGELTVDMAQVLMRAIKNKVAQYPTDLSADEKALLAAREQRAGAAKSRLEMAVEVRMGEKMILTNTYNTLWEHIERVQQHPNKKRKTG